MPTGLQRRGARYSLRVRTPKDLRGVFGGEVVRALGTADPREARRLLAFRMAALLEEFDQARANLAQEAEKARDAAPSWDPWAGMTEAQWEHEIETLELASAEMSRLEFEREEREALEGQILAKAASPDNLTQEELAVRDLIRDRDEEIARLRELAKIAPLLAKDAAENNPAETQSVVYAPTQKKAESKSSSEDRSLGDVVERWARERKPSAKGIDAHQAVARWFIERVGERPIATYTRQDVITFKDKLLSEGQTTTNVKVKVGRLRTLFGCALQAGWVADNVASEVTIWVAAADKRKRLPFDASHLKALFGSEVYSLDVRPAAGRGEAAYWLPLLALYTGARLEELGQLRPADIVEQAYQDKDEADAKAWLIKIAADPEEGLKLKNAGSQRVVPVHPTLQALGFIKFVEAARQASQKRLFPDLRPDKYGRLTAKWGEWFSAYKRETCGIADGRYVFHSFRHTFKQCVRHVQMPEGVQRQLMGHAAKDVADAYGDGYPLHILVDWMAKYKVPGFAPPPPPPAFRS